MSRHVDRSESKLAALGMAVERTPLQDHVIDLARRWRRNRRLTLRPSLDEAGFDEAFTSVSNAVQATVGVGDFPTFMHALKGRAGDIAVPWEGGALLHGKLFAMPIHGTAWNLHDALSSKGTAHMLARSLRVQGLAHTGSTMLMSSLLVSPSHLARCGPQRIRDVARHVISLAMLDKEFLVPEMDALIGRLLGGIAASSLPADQDVISHYALIGMRVLATAEGQAPPTDFFRHFVPKSAIESDDEEEVKIAGEEMEETWNDAMGRILDIDTCRLALPCDFVDAVTTSACDALDAAMAVQGNLHAIDLRSMAHAVHMTTNQEALLVSFEFDDGILGPAAVPLELVACDPETVSDHALFYARPGTVIRQHDDASTIPRGATRFN